MDPEAQERPKKLVAKEYDLLLTFPGGCDEICSAELEEKADVKITWRGNGVFRVLSRTEPRVLIGEMRSLNSVMAFLHTATLDSSFTTKALRSSASTIEYGEAAKVWAATHPQATTPPTPTQNSFKHGRLQSPRLPQVQLPGHWCDYLHCIFHKITLILREAREFASGMIYKTGWKADIHNAVKVVHIDVFDAQIYAGLVLHDPIELARNRHELGRTTTRSSIAYCMARTAKIRPGDIVIDPMAGVGTIPIEASQSYPLAAYFACEVETKAVASSQANALKFGSPLVNVVRWNAIAMPFKDGSVDVVLCDLPFGHRHGSFQENASLYPKFFKQLTRVVKIGGRVVLMTTETGIMKTTLKAQSKNGWTLVSSNFIDNGFKATLYELLRTEPSRVTEEPTPATASTAEPTADS